ncbi:MAG: hypothetical protein IKM20_05755 [Erysipelotrichales bacterium]|nr:hypothetical protein [Erysipelotrichales bacterium]
MTIKKINYVLNFTSFLFCSIAILLAITFNLEYKLSIIEIDNRTSINYHSLVSELEPNDTIIFKEKDMYHIDTYLSKDICNYRITTTSYQMPYSAYIGKVLFILPFHVPFKALSIILYFISVILTIFCLFKLHQLNYLPNKQHIKQLISKIKLTKHQSLRS